ncbi:sensor histidine kinase [Promicromonospora sp. NPDC019610]|uniref:sensor histidine kinase n=1 Tax=Promicromonospora sp. NPDC019610 TaxID=3364405 RepID=UPI00379C87AD
MTQPSTDTETATDSEWPTEPIPEAAAPAAAPGAAQIAAQTVAEATPVRAGAPAAGLSLAAVFMVLLVLAGVDPWWMIPLAAVAAPLGLSDRGARRGVLVLAVAAAAGAVAVLAGWADLRDVLVATSRGVVTGVLPWSVAMAWRTRRAAEADAATALVREQDARRLRAETELARQRLHLAESLHDDLGHALSLVALNLGRLELELERGRDTEADPGTAVGLESERCRPSEVLARESVALARRQISDAVVRLGASVQTLRTGLPDGPPATGATTGSLDEVGLDALVEEARRAGADVELSRSPGPGRLARFGPTVFRVVQEGLTNALKHAPGQPVRIVLQEDGERLVVVVRNPLPAADVGRPSAGPTGAGPARDDLARGDLATTGGGTGVRALERQVRAAGGSIEAGPAGSGYVLRAALHPALHAAVVPSSGRTPADRHGGPGAAPARAAGVEPTPAPQGGNAVTDGLTRARRRGGVLLLAAVLVPAAALVVVAGGIQLADHLAARRALLDPTDFVRIAVGDARSDVAPLLPGAPLEPPRGADPACDHYAVTADPLADASGDAYRICWSGDRVTSTDLVVGGAS